MTRLTTDKLNATGYIVNSRNRSIEEITYGSYLSEYGSDDTTTPNGVAGRMHVREVEVLNEFEFDEDGDCIKEELAIEYQIWSWGINGNNPRFTGTKFDNEEDADIELYEYCESYIDNHNWDAPQWFGTHREAVEELATILDRNIEVIERYLSLSEHVTAKRLLERAEAEAKREAFKAAQNLAIESEAAVLLTLIDAEFQSDLTAAMQLTGDNKAKECSRLFVAFLNRCGHVKVQSDFWRVFRILKSKVSK